MGRREEMQLSGALFSMEVLNLKHRFFPILTILMRACKPPECSFPWDT